MLTKGELYTHCKQIENEANRIFNIEYKRALENGYSNVQAVSYAKEFIFQQVIYK